MPLSGDAEQPEDVTPVQAKVLQAGSLIVLASLSFGLGAGHWPVWSPAVGAAAYLVWCVVYAEATIQSRAASGAFGAAANP